MRANRVPEWRERDWRTFAAKDCADIAKAVHLATVAADPLTPVAPADHPLLQGVVGMANEAHAITWDGRGTHGDRRRRSPRYDESKLTAYLDERLRRGADGAWTTPAAGTLPATRRATSAPSWSTCTSPGASTSVPRARPSGRSSPTHRSGSSPRPAGPRVPRPRRRGGRPPVVPAPVGLLLPVRADSSRLRRSHGSRRSSGRAAVTAPVAHRGSRSPPSATARSVAAQPGRPAIWSDGALTLGDPEVFDVVDVDPDGSAIKAERFLTTMPRLALTQLQEMPADAASPALRATGSR